MKHDHALTNFFCFIIWKCHFCLLSWESWIVIPGQLDLWFDPRNNGVNKEARVLNRMIRDTLQGTDVQLLDLTYLSEFRADAHPATWLGKKDAVEIWGQDCMHWCLPGVPDTWVDIVSELIRIGLETGWLEVWQDPTLKSLMAYMDESQGVWFEQIPCMHSRPRWKSARCMGILHTKILIRVWWKRMYS